MTLAGTVRRGDLAINHDDHEMPMSHNDQALQPCLPLELQDLVLHHLSNDRSVLIRSSLVCKDWRNICSPMLFASIDLSSRPGEKAGARFKGFSQLTRAPSYPKFLAEVQHIKIDGEAKPEAILEVQAERLDCLASVCVAGNLRDGVKDAEFYGAISRQFPGLKRLDLVGAVFKKRSTLLEFLSSFAELRSLALGNMRWTAPEDWNTPVSSDAGSLPAIENLRITLKPMDHLCRFVLAWLAEQLEARASLKSLDYTMVVASPPPIHTRSFLQHASPTLDRMTLDFETGSLALGESHDIVQPFYSYLSTSFATSSIRPLLRFSPSNLA